MRLDLTDTLALLDRLLEKEPQTPKPGGFTVRLRRLRELLAETNSAEPTLAAIAGFVFPGVSPNSLRTTLLEFRKSLAGASSAARLRFELIRPDARGLNMNEVICYFEGLPLSKGAELRQMISSAVAFRKDTPLVRARVAAFKRSDLENLDAISLQPSFDGRERLRFFISYATKDASVVARLLEPLLIDLNLSKRFHYDFWRDRRILPGEQWHTEIQDALSDCDFGLALVSRNFLASDYIADYELATLVSGDRPVIPVGLGLLDYPRQNLRGLEEKQIYRFEIKPNDFRCFGECSGQVAERFILDLAKKIEERAEKTIQTRKETIALRALADPDFLLQLSKSNPAFHQAVLSINKKGDSNCSEQAVITPAGVHDRQTETQDFPLPSKLNHLRQFSLNTIPPELKAKINASAATLNLAAAEKLISGSDTDEVIARLERWRQDAVLYLGEWFRDPKQPAFAAVLGEIGSGKTTMLQMLARNLVKGVALDAPSVFFVDLRDYVGDKDPTLEHLLVDQLRRHDHSGQVTFKDILDAIQNNGGLMIFDGLDEKIIPLAEGPRQRFISELFRVLPPDVMDRPVSSGRGRIIISCRSHYFPSVLALSSGFTGQQREAVRASDFTTCIMLPWNNLQISDYLTQTLGSDRVDAALEIIGSVHNLTDLSRRPYLLSLIAPQLHDLEMVRASGRPVNGASLYEAFVEKWLLRDEGKHVFTKEHKLLMMECLAADLWRENSREWPWNKVAEWLDTFLYDHPVVASRYARESVPTDILSQDFRTATFLLRPDASRNGFRFAHTSLQEYFLACRLVKALASSDVAAVWDLPMPSLESFDFAGQILETMHLIDLVRVFEGWKSLLGGADQPIQARLAALAFLLRAAEHGLPFPEKIVLRAQDLDLTGWKFFGSANQPLRLAAADFSGATLIRARFHCVELAGSRWRGADLCSAEFNLCNLESADFTAEAENITCLEGARFRESKLAYSKISGGILSGMRVELPVWNSSTQQDWDNELASYRSGLSSSSEGYRKLPKAGGPTSQLPPVMPFSSLPEACWSLGHFDSVLSVSVSPDGQRFVSGSYDESLCIWDAFSGECIRVLNGHSSAVLNVLFSSDGQYIFSSSYDKSIRFWDANSGECLRAFEGHRTAVLGIALSQDGRRLASCSLGFNVRVWDVDSGRCLHVLKGHTSPINAVVFEPTGNHIISASEDQSIRIWDADSGECCRVFNNLSSAVSSVAVTPDGQRIISGSKDNCIRVWDRVSGECLLVLQGHSSAVSSVAVSPCGRQIVSGSSDKTISVWDVASGECLKVLSGHSSAVSCLAISPDGKIVISGSEDRSIRIWNSENGVCRRIIKDHLIYFKCAKVSPDGRRILTGSNDNGLRVLDADNGRCIYTLPGCLNTVSSLAFSRDGLRILCGFWAGTVRAWDIESGVPMEVTEDDRRCLQILRETDGDNWFISPLRTIKYQRPDGTKLDIAVLPDGGYVVLEKPAADAPWKIARAKGEYWRYVNYATDGPEGRVLWSADALGPVPEV